MNLPPLPTTTSKSANASKAANASKSANASKKGSIKSSAAKASAFVPGLPPLPVPQSTTKVEGRNEKDKKEKREREEYEKWRKDLKEFLRYTFLPRILSSESALDKLVSDEAMKTWEVAFTHESFDPNQGKNYEELELAGDSYLEAAYMKFITQTYPQLNRSQLSELRTVYLAKPFLANLSLQLGLPTFLRTRFGKNIHTNEDAIESVFGALENLGDDLFKFGAGSGLSYNLVVDLYQNIEINIESTKANPKTRVKEIYERLGIINPKIKEKVPENVNVDENGSVTFTITMPNNGLTILHSLGINIASPIVAQTVANSKTSASVLAYAQAIKFLEGLGLTDEFIDAYVKNRDLNNPELQPYIVGIQNRLKEEGYVSFYFNEDHLKGTHGGATTGKYVQLIGVKADGTKKILNMTPEPVAVVLNAKQKLLEQYKNYQDI